MNRTIQSAIAATILLAPLSGNGDESQPMLMRVGYSGRLSTDVGRGDVQVAVELWARQVTTKMGLEVVPCIGFFDNKGGLEKRHPEP